MSERWLWVPAATGAKAIAGSTRPDGRSVEETEPTFNFDGREIVNIFTMNTPNIRPVLALCLCVSAALGSGSPQAAGQPAKRDEPIVQTHPHSLPDTLMTKRGQLLLSEDFAQPIERIQPPAKPARKPAWRVLFGQWETVDGALKGVEIAAHKHAALTRTPIKFKAAVIQFDVRLEGSRQTTITVNDLREHVCSVRIDAAGFAAQKDDHDHGGPDEDVPFGRIAMPLDPGRWHTILVEFHGEEMVATVGGRSIAGKHPLLAEEKYNFGFTVRGDGASFRNLRVWEALPNPDWPRNQATIAADLAGRSPKRPDGTAQR